MFINVNVFNFSVREKKYTSMFEKDEYYHNIACFDLLSFKFFYQHFSLNIINDL